MYQPSLVGAGKRHFDVTQKPDTNVKADGQRRRETARCSRILCEASALQKTAPKARSRQRLGDTRYMHTQLWNNKVSSGRRALSRHAFKTLGLSRKFRLTDTTAPDALVVLRYLCKDSEMEGEFFDDNNATYFTSQKGHPVAQRVLHSKIAYLNLSPFIYMVLVLRF